MSDVVFGIVSHYGILAILTATYLSCLAIPMPSSLVMLAGGAFVASGDLVTAPVVLAALAGAVFGDQTGFLIGRIGGTAATLRWAHAPHRAAVFARARQVVDRWGGLGVFFSTWLVSPLGPYVNLLAGATHMRWWRFTFWDTAGEAIWVAFYVGLGYAFSSRIVQVAELLANSVAFLSAAVVTSLLGLLLVKRARRIQYG